MCDALTMAKQARVARPSWLVIVQTLEIANVHRLPPFVSAPHLTTSISSRFYPSGVTVFPKTDLALWRILVNGQGRL